MEETRSLRDKTARGFLWGGINNGTVQVLGALFGIVMLRLLTPADYGKVAMLMVFSNLAATIQESGFTAALCNRRPTHRDYNAVFWFNIFCSALLYGVLWCLAPFIARFYGDPVLLPLSRYLFLGFFISSWGTVQRAWLFIHLKNKQTCIIAITALLVSGLVGMGMAWAGMAYWGLATQNILFVLVVALMNWYYSPWRPTLHIDLRPAWQMFGFSSRLLVASILNQLSSNAFGILLGKFYGDVQAGFYSNARKWNDMCSGTIGGMLTGVAQPVLSQVVDNRERYCQVFRKMLRFVSFISFPALLGMGLVSREFLLIVAGGKWESSARLLTMLSLYGAIFPLLTLYSQLTISQGRSRINVWCTSALSALILSGLVALHSFGIYVMVTYFIAINMAWLFVWQYFAGRLVGLRLHQALSDVLPFALLAAASMTATWFVTLPITHVWVLLLAKVVVAAGLYLGILWVVRAAILRESIHYLLGMRKPATP